MKASIQTRVLWLAGAGVFAAAAALSLLGRSSLLSLERDIASERERLVAVVAERLSSAAYDDLRLLSMVGDAPDPASASTTLRSLVRFGRLASAAFVVSAEQSLTLCEPAAECRTLATDAIVALALDAISAQRPIVSNAVPQPDGTVRLVAVLPARLAGSRGAAGITIASDDPRLTGLLASIETATGARIELRDGNGMLLAGTVTAASSADGGDATARVAGTAWSILDDLGLAPAIGWLAEQHLATTGVAVRCELADIDVRLPPEIETAIFRAVQETIANGARHARAESVLVQAWVERGTLVIEVEDDGIRFDPQDVVTSPESLRGIGLLGMRERIEILGGTLQIDSAPGRGTRVVMNVPLQSELGAP